MARRRPSALLFAVSALVLGVVATACGGDRGGLVIDGSSTVFPVTAAAAEGYRDVDRSVNIEVRSSGTGGGFEVFCTGESDISNASRPIKDREAERCAANGVGFQEIRVGSDGITVVTRAGAPVEGNLTIEQLNEIWNPESTIGNWSEITDGDFDSVPLILSGPDDQSGTFDFFNEEVLGEDESGLLITPRSDYTASADDNVIINAITGVEAGLGYFGYSYFTENEDRLSAFSIDGVAPTAESINADEYPLARPLLIYVSTEKLETKPELAEFVTYYLENAVALAESVDVVPAPQDALDEGLAAIGG